MVIMFNLGYKKLILWFRKVGNNLFVFSEQQTIFLLLDRVITLAVLVSDSN